MKKLILGAVALAVVVGGLGGLNTRTAEATVTNMWVVNVNVWAGLGGDCDVSTGAACLDAVEAASADQLGQDVTETGPLLVVIQTDGSPSPVRLNGKGFICAEDTADNLGLGPAGLDTGIDGAYAFEACDGAADAATDANNRAYFLIVSPGAVARGDSRNIEPFQDALGAGKVITVVGAPHDMTLSAALGKDTIQEMAPSCAITDSITHPTRTGLLANVVDIDGTSLAGALVDWETSNANVVDIALAATVSMQLEAGPVSAFNVACGDSTGEADVRAITDVLGVTDLTRSLTITVTGVPANVDLVASPAAIPCDGVTSSTVTATVTDSDGNDVVDGTPVNFSVVALGIASPINTTTEGGMASSQITPLSAATAGVTVVVTSGDAQSSILVACEDEVDPIDPVDPVEPPITPPATGTGFTAQGGGFPMWTLLALAAAGLAVMGGGLVTRRAGQ